MFFFFFFITIITMLYFVFQTYIQFFAGTLFLRVIGAERFRSRTAGEERPDKERTYIITQIDTHT